MLLLSALRAESPTHLLYGFLLKQVPATRPPMELYRLGHGEVVHLLSESLWKT